MKYFVPCIAAFCACFGFSLLYQIRGKKLVIAALCGAFAWAVYLIASELFGLSVAMASFFGGAAAALYSEIAARLCRMPVTVCLIPGIIPTVPGLTIYRTMRECLIGNTEGFLSGCITTLKIGGAIALGLVLVSSCIRLFRNDIRHFRRERQ